MTTQPRPYSMRLAERPHGIGPALTIIAGLGLVWAGLAAMLDPPALSGWTFAGAIIALAGGGLIARVVQVNRANQIARGGEPR